MIQISKRLWCVQISWVVVFVLLMAAIPVFAQLPTATILGVVKDTSGGTVSGATVTVTNADTGVARTGTTGDDGAYRFPGLPVGDYQIQIMKDGFETAQRKGLTLVVDQAAAIDFTLQVGSTGQTVTVTEEAPQVNTTSATVGGLVTSNDVSDLPLNGRDLVNLTLMQSGVVQSSVFSMTNAVGATNIVGVTFSANGADIHNNNYILDGAIMTSIMATNNASILGTTLGVDGVKEYKVVSSLPPAEYGLVMGSTSTIVSKGGTNQFHGDAFDYLRNSSMDARNYFDALDTANFFGFGTNKSAVYPGKRIPPFQRNNYGASIGGPIKKDKTFFYAVFEGLEQRLGVTVADNTLPGNCFDQVAGDATYHQPIASTIESCTGTTAATINPAMLKLYTDPNVFPGQNGLFPYPDTNINPATGIVTASGLANYSYPYKQPSGEQYGQLRIDQNFSTADTLFARYTQDDADQVANGSYAQVRNFENSTSQLATISENHVFSPTVLNTLRYSFQRTTSISNITVVPGITDPNVLLVPSATSSFQVFGSLSPGSGVTAWSASGGGNGTYKQNIYSYSDDVYWTKGKNAFKFGGVLNEYQSSMNYVFDQGGTVTFPSLGSSGLGDFSAITTVAGTDYPFERRYYLYSDMGFYAQDDYRASSKLTLNLGLRYEFATVPRESNGLDFNIPNILTANEKNGSLGAVPDRMFENMSLHDFSPRFGFAYDPFGKGTMSIRGGAGLYYDVGSYGAAMIEEACCQAPTSYFNITNNNQATPPYTFNIPLPTAQIGPGAAGDAGVLYGGASVASATAAPSPRNVDYYMHQPSMLEYNLTIDRQLVWDMSMTVAYIGSRGHHLDTTKEANPTQPLGFLPNGLPYFCNVAINPASTDPTCTGSSNPASPYFLSRANPEYGPVTQYTAESDSWYNSLQINVTKRTSHGLEFANAFTWSKLLDDGQAQQPGEMTSIRTSDPTDHALDKGLSGFDAALNERFNFIYHAPSFKSDRMYYKPLNGWWFSSITSITSGYAFNPTLGVSRSFTNNQSSTDRPNLSPTYDGGSVITGNPLEWFNPTMFSVPVAGTFGNAPRDGLRQPWLKDVDFSAVKDTKARFLGEAGSVQFRAEIFNILNHPNWGAPNAEVWAPGAGQSAGTNPQGGPISALGAGGTFPAFSKIGQITTTNNNSRQIQLALKVIF
jgi:hypothetical protein